MSREENAYIAMACKFTKGIGNIRGREILEDKEQSSLFLHKISDETKRAVEKELIEVKKKNTKIVTILDSNYPEQLKHIHNAPILLYYYGVLPSGFSMAVVGTRKPSKYGITTTQMIVSQLCEYKIPIISGFAYGIDTVAHQVSLENNNPTTAVLGAGIDIMYPALNTWMRKRIIDGDGCILTEFSFGTLARPSNFPVRNRIISGLSQGVLIVEAAMSSGSIITAEMGLEQGKTIFTIPGTVFGSSFKGSHNLVRMGAVLVENGYQILDEFPEYKSNIQNSTNIITDKKTQKHTKPIDIELEDSHIILQEEKIKKQISDLTRDEVIIYENISKEPISAENIINQAGFSAPKTLSLLTSLMLKGLIEEKGGLYSRVK